MKKFKTLMLSMVALILGTFLTACTFKEAEANFSQEVVYLEEGKELKLDDYLSVKGIEKSEVSYEFSNPLLFDITGKTVKAKENQSGSSFVYATYKNNSLDSMQIVVRKDFAKPSGFSMSENGLISWTHSASFFENENSPTKASQYLVEGFYRAYSTDGTASVEPKNISETVNTNQYQIPEGQYGEYTLTVQALSVGNFDESEKSEEKTFYYGYMPKLEAERLSWTTDGMFSWDVSDLDSALVSRMSFKVKFDDLILENTHTTNSANLSTYFDNAKAGSHKLSIMIYDNQNKLIVRESEGLEVVKHEVPTVEYVEGLLKIVSTENVEEYKIYTSRVGQPQTIKNMGEDVYTALDSLACGLYTVEVVAYTKDGNFYQSDRKPLDKQIYKLDTVILNGVGGNEENGQSFKALAETDTSLVDVQFKILGLETTQVVDGFEAGEFTKEFSIAITEGGTYQVSAVLTAKNINNIVGEGNDVYVLNSIESEALEIVKVDAFEGNLVHKYDTSENFSEISFEKVNGATDYVVYFYNNENYEPVPENFYQVDLDNSKIVFTDKIEKLFAAQDSFKFKLVATTQNETLSINSAKEKEIDILNPPETNNSGNSLDKTYSWAQVEGADAYRLEYAVLDKNTYEGGIGEIENPSLTIVNNIQTNSYAFAQNGYYYVRVYALSEDENVSISSVEYLEELFYLADKLVLGDIEFGYSEEYKNYSEFSQASGYFLKIEKVKNIDEYQIELTNGNSSTYMQSDTAQESLFLLAEGFATEGVDVEISVVGMSTEDPVIFEDSDTKSLTIHLLKAIGYDDVEVVDLAQRSLTIKNREGSTGLFVKNIQTADTYTKNSGEDAVVNIASQSNIELEVELYGTERVGNIYQSTEKIYLPNKTNSLRFERIQMPKNLNYYNGNLVFEHTMSANVSYYIVDMYCLMADDTETKISIVLSSSAYLMGERLSENISIGTGSTFVETSASNITIKVSDLIEQFQSLIPDLIGQVVGVEFEVYGYQSRKDADKMILSTLPATIYGNDTETRERVEKISARTLTLSYDVSNYTLSWDEVVEIQDSSIAAQTQYEIYSVGSEGATLLKTISGATRFNLERSDYSTKTNYEFYIVATNPYYLQSGQSNAIRFYNLSALEKVTITNDGYISYQHPEMDYIEYIQYKIDGGSAQQDATGRIEIAGAGEYSLKAVGKQILDGETKIYYIDSQESIWTLAKMETIKPTSTELDYANNKITWDAFGVEKGLTTLSYLVMFKDENDSAVLYETKNCEVDFTTDTTLYNSFAALAEGDIDVSVYAVLKPYSTVAGQTVYYADAIDLLNGNSERNHFAYTSTNIKKLSTPVVESVEFLHNADLSDAQTPVIKVTFSGNFAVGDVYSVFINDQAAPVYSSTISEVGQQSFELAREIYNNGFASGQTMTIKIKVTGDTSLPSSTGKVDIIRATDLSKISFVRDKGFTQTLKVEIDPKDVNCLAGGIILKINITSDKDYIIYKKVDFIGSENPYAEYQLSDIFETYLTDGGTIKVSGFVNNYANDTETKYYLASPNLVTGEQYTVLKSVQEAALTRQEGGFVIGTANNPSTTYVVSYGSENYDVSGNFYFEIPDAWTDGSYTLNIYAQEEGFVDSCKTEIVFNVSRIASVESVSMQRKNADDISEITLSWDAVSGATGYRLEMFKSGTDDLLFTANLGTDTEYTLGEIFGDNYATLIESGFNELNFNSDYAVRFELVTIGNTSKNDSHIYDFEATFAGNNLLETLNLQDSISVDEYGFIQFNAIEGTKYIYRFVDNSGVELKQWEEIVAESEKVKVDASEIDEDILSANTLYNIEIIVLGTASTEGESSSADFNFKLDSLKATSHRKDLTFAINPSAVSVGYFVQLPSSLAFTMASNSFTKIYAGLSEDALEKGEVVEFVPEETEIPAGANQTVYSYSPLDLINLFDKAGFVLDPDTTTIDLYFWTYRETESIDSSYTNSRHYEFSFDYVPETTFEGVKKMGLNDGTNTNYDGLGYVQNYEDFANVYAVFEDNDSIESLTLGVFIRITQLPDAENEGGDLFNTTKFLSKLQMTDDKYFDSSKIVVNLTKVFEEEDLINLIGSYKVEFARIQVSILNAKFTISHWTSKNTDGKDLIFKRLPEVKELKIKNGNLSWIRNGETTSKFYVYFSDDVELSENYAYFATQHQFYDAASYLGENDSYYVAVQSISEDVYLLPSRRTFIIDLDGVEVKVTKNQINSKLELKDGRMVFDWSVDSEIYKLIMADADFAETADSLASMRFLSPFSFTIRELLDNKLMVRFKFTPLSLGSEGNAKLIDVNAKYLLEDLFLLDGNIQSRLEAIYNAAPATNGVNQLIARFIEFIKTGTHGVANSSILFDQYFEDLQLGAYKLEYSLLGTENSLNSKWYTYSNSNSENAFYVNAEPYVKAIKEPSPTDKAINSYKVLIQKSEIYTYESGEYATTIAENYVFKLSGEDDFVFHISKGIDNYSLKLVGDNDNTISVYETNDRGVVTEGGDYLMFFINYNNGDSILGVYGDELIKTTYKMQVYAVGNNISASSKSEFFNLVLLSFGQNIRINDGVFSWTAQINRTTSVIYKRELNQEEEETTVSGDGVTSIFDMNDFGADNYQYLKFIMKGEVTGNRIYVDSEIYQIDSVYKLNAPTLNTSIGEIEIDDSSNEAWLANCFESSGSLYNYMIYNNVSSKDLNIKFSDTDLDRKVKYQAGITNIDDDSSEFAYKDTEVRANTFYVSSLGTTATFKAEKDASLYYLYKLYCIEDPELETISTKKVAVRSNFAELDAQMLDTPSGLKIENGMLKWQKVESRYEEAGLKTVPETAKTVYKVAIVQYKISATERGESDTNVGDVYYYYTTNPYFDFELITESQIIETDYPTYLKATVQAMALNVSTSPYGGSVSLIEGGYAYGFVDYTDTTTKILLSNGETFDKIDRLAPVENVKVENGSIWWEYTTDTSVTEENFFESYNFMVTDEDGKEIAGQSTVTIIEQGEEINRFSVRFIEVEGYMPTGKNTLIVYASQGSRNVDSTIKSFGREVEIDKLETIEPSDFILTASETYEVFDLSKYYLDGNTNVVIMTATWKDGSSKSITFGSEVNKLYIVTEASSLEYPTDFVYNDYLIIGEEDVVSITFKVKPLVYDNITLDSDESENLVFQRTSLKDSNIEWNEELQRFEWDYLGVNAFETSVNAIAVRAADVLIEDSVLYTDQDLEIASEITLTAGSEVYVEETLSGVAKILYLSQSYYIDKSILESRLLEGEESQLSAGTLYTIVEEKGEKTIIEANGQKFIVDTAEIVLPIYTVEITYGESEDTAITRTYTTTSNYFEPTIIGVVKLALRVKLGESNLQSQKIVLEENFTFDLFEQGEGTETNPYVITSATQFKNIVRRMTKDESNKKYVYAGEEISDSNPYYFSIMNDIDLGEFTGILLPGTFDGIILGNNRTIRYSSKGVAKLTDSITVRDGNVLSASNLERQTTFSYGTSLFEVISEKSTIQDLQLDISYVDSASAEAVKIAQNSLLAGLTITNRGKIDKVDLVGFNNMFVGYKLEGERIMMVYSGVASINTGSVAVISNCEARTDIYITDFLKMQVIFVSAITYTNYAIIENCTVGEGYTITIDCQANEDIIQAAGIAITNTSSASITGCINNYDIEVTAANSASENIIVAFVGGIVSLGTGELSSNGNTGDLTTENIDESRVYIGTIYATNRRPS